MFIRSAVSSRLLMVLIVGLLVSLVGCSTTPAYENAFNASQQIKGDSETFHASLDNVQAHVLTVLPQQGFIVENIDANAHLIKARRDLKDPKDSDRSYTIHAAITLVPMGADATRVILAANRETEIHHKEHTWWHLLWIVPLFPTGTQYTTVVAERDTIHSPQFYNGFFSAVQTAMKADAPVVTPASDSAPPAVEAVPTTDAKAAVAPATTPAVH